MRAASTRHRSWRCKRDALDSGRLADPDIDLIGPIAEARDELVALLADTGAIVDALDRATRLLPAVLGADGPRNILLLIQNNAELRSTGGVPSALALIHAEGGALSLAAQADSGDTGRFDPIVTELPVESRALWGNNPARYMQDVAFLPQFPLGAPIAREMWRQRFGVEPDLVVALDPVVLSHVLEATGPVTMSTGDVLEAGTVVQRLLADVYARYPNPADQDAFFAGAAAAVFEAVAGGSAGAADPRPDRRARTVGRRAAHPDLERGCLGAGDSRRHHARRRFAPKRRRPAGVRGVPQRHDRVEDGHASRRRDRRRLDDVPRRPARRVRDRRHPHEHRARRRGDESARVCDRWRRLRHTGRIDQHLGARVQPAGHLQPRGLAGGCPYVFCQAATGWVRAGTS
ncbi:DUF4012 domain-containing protein [Agromyces larvae]|uniref:DUF4012 domain-containing protein n=1 Tax=Agromyces larvae TaxID=2929802 RepID=A0ABY4BYQ9_9MICO|nr:DUF4012 domain-containing protein [Agromyces larvae]UOE44317.1 DUF4012 domain-containing protein [Agromyces larvae]